MVKILEGCRRLLNSPPSLIISDMQTEEAKVSTAPVESGMGETDTPQSLKEQEGPVINGDTLREQRENHSWSVEDVSRITKIPNRYLKALEAQDPPKLPARVYIQGFVKNLATLYKLDPVITAKLYLKSLDLKSTKP